MDAGRLLKCRLAIGGLFYLLSLFIVGMAEPIARMVQWLAFINVALAIFNFIPGFPLDGGRVFRSLLWQITGNYQRSTQIATQVGRRLSIYSRRHFNSLPASIWYELV